MFDFREPTFLCRSFHDVPFDELKGLGVKVLGIDVDNTLALQGSHELPEDTRRLLAGLVEGGSEVFLASNSYRDLEPMAGSFGGGIHQPRNGIPRKPNRGYFTAILERTGVMPHEVVMIGDKYFFDANPAIRVGMKAVLVNPLGHDLIGDRLMAIRFFENLALRRIGLARPI